MSQIRTMIIVLLLGASMIFIESKAEGAQEKSYDMGKITVTAKKVPFGVSQSVENVTVITNDKITRLPARVGHPHRRYDRR